MKKIGIILFALTLTLEMFIGSVAMPAEAVSVSVKEEDRIVLKSAGQRMEVSRGTAQEDMLAQYSENDFRYTVYENGVFIEEYLGSDENIIVPGTIDGYEINLFDFKIIYNHCYEE